MTERSTEEAQLIDRGAGDPDRLQRLWTPHRMSYIVGSPKFGGSAGSSQPFTDIPMMADEEGLVIARGELVYSVLNLYPYNPGHLMVVPYRQVSELEDLTDAESAELMTFTQKAIRVIKSVSRPDGLTSGSTWADLRADRWPNTCTCMWCRAGPATRTSSPWSGRPR